MSQSSDASSHVVSSLRPWQAEALEAWLRAGRRGIVEVATGGGKTRFALACVNEILDSGSRVEIIVPTIALADQWHVVVQEDIGLPQSSIALLSSRSVSKDLRPINIVVVNSARSLPLELWGIGRFLIVDECHRAGSPVNARAMSGLTTAALGLSATPERQYDDFFYDHIVPALGNVIYKYPVEQAILDGVLTSFSLTNVRVALGDNEQDEYEAITRRVRAIAGQQTATGEERLSRLLMQRARVSNNALIRIPVAAKLLDRHRGQRGIVFHESIDAANSIASLLSHRGHSVALYHSQLGDALRRENLRLFRRGVYDVLVTCKALDEGINVPEVSVAVIAAASASNRQRIQRLGRVLRPAAGKTTAEVYTIYATDSEEERLRAEADRLAGVAHATWMRAGANK